MVRATAVEGVKSGRLRVGMTSGGRNAFIGAVRLEDARDASRAPAEARN